MYLFFAYCLVVIAKKTNNEAISWWGWIPIFNAFLMLKIAGKPMWWFILLLIPLVNIVFAAMVWMGIASARNKPSWLGILILVPLVNFVIPPYLAFSDQA
jgi:hypothetical protein